MRNLIQLIVQFQNFFLFILLEAICIFLIVRSNPYQQVKFLNSSNFISGSVFNTYANWSEYFKLGEVNDSLMNENAALRRQLMLSKQVDEFVWDTVSETVNDTSIRQLYLYLPAAIINRSTTKVANYFTLNKGRRHGIEDEMGVIGKNGAVGVVTRTSENFSIVMPLININSRLSVRLKKQYYSGNVLWNGKDPGTAELRDIPKHVNIKQGDTVVTSGYSTFFPPDILVGVVKEVELEEGSNFYDIMINLSTNFETLEYVYVVDYLFKAEREALEVE